ncbi:hypothetical protein DN412_26525 [Cupriavidus lacunae]|uniref:Uncharacterized protein n=1 Tax=Cupriavidus lacunae TaxID=2666307 RepID=A0A370NP95_9BURK|nr:hypothetical protein DN412_26525 [Cupriavidus lacunae]
MLFKFPGADVLLYAEGHIARRAIASAVGTRRGLRPWHVSTNNTREPDASRRRTGPGVDWGILKGVDILALIEGRIPAH